MELVGNRMSAAPPANPGASVHERRGWGEEKSSWLIYVLTEIMADSNLLTSHVL